MSFREKSAWITFFLLLFGFGFYFVLVLRQIIHPVHPHTNFFALFFALLVLIIVIEIVLHIIAAFRSPKEANRPADEREKLIALKAKRPAFYVLMVATFLAIGVAHTGAGVWPMLNAILFAMWLGDLTNYGAQVFYFRRET
jgi:hypothetical protein